VKTQSFVAEELPAERPAPGLLGLAERGWIPDALLRGAIRHQCAARLAAERAGGAERYQQVINLLRDSPIAVHTDSANSQHYEVPAEFFVRCLGPRLKYSCAYYPLGTESLSQAEEKMLQLYGERAGLADGYSILELGCGWGSLTLWMAEHYPNAKITAVSNSNTQRRYIQNECARRGLRNVNVITRNVVCLELPANTFDRCVSIEMFEHLRNYGQLLERISRWLKPEGKLFVHIFAHATLSYPFETEGSDNWLGRHFFTGGLMPAADTLLWFQQHMRIEQRWQVAGTHYMRTANHWLGNQDAHRHEVLGILQQAYGHDGAQLWFQRWRMFWMACAELFGYDNGREWMICHYLFTPRA
jgi:cyclopropane-fatty-acyl-phospholipid synthase